MVVSLMAFHADSFGLPELVITAILVLTFVTAKKQRLCGCPPPVARPVGDLPKGKKPLTRRSECRDSGDSSKPNTRSR